MNEKLVSQEVRYQLHDPKPGFWIDLHHKDMSIALSDARDASAALPLLTVTVTEVRHAPS
jgi:3-hydroxyisobutyrate dehydrogenase-like beta-hydroxyacid dehydrogenase